MADTEKQQVRFIIEPHSNSSQKCIGTYPEGVSREQVEKHVKGTFGGRFEKFGGGHFTYIAYTD